MGWPLHDYCLVSLRVKSLAYSSSLRRAEKDILTIFLGRRDDLVGCAFLREGTSGAIRKDMGQNKVRC